MLLRRHKRVDCASVKDVFASAFCIQNRKALSRARLLLFKAFIDELSHRNVRLGLVWWNLEACDLIDLHHRLTGSRSLELLAR